MGRMAEQNCLPSPSAKHSEDERKKEENDEKNKGFLSDDNDFDAPVFAGLYHRLGL